MRKLIVTLVILFPLFLGARNQITLKDGTSFVAVAKSFESGYLYFNSNIPPIKKNIEFNMLNSISDGFTSFIVDAFHNVNPPVEFHKKINDESIVAYQAIVATPPLEYNFPAQLSPSEFSPKAEKRYLTAIGFVIGGGVLLALGISNDEEALIIAGGTAVIVGGTIAITGHYQLIGANKPMNREAITLSAAEHGIGFAINF